MNKIDTKDPKRIWLIAVAIVMAVYVISLFVPYISNVTRYPIYLVKCGKQPLAGNRFAVAYSYSRPGESTYALADEYFCSDEEAQAAGFRPRN